MVLRKSKTGIGIVVLSIAMIAMSSCSSKPETSENENRKLVKTAKVVEKSTVEEKQYPGTIEEEENVNLAFRVAGKIENIYVKEGKYIEKGQLIAQLDARDYEIQKREFEVQVTQMRSEYDRIEELKNRASVAENDYEKMKAAKEVLETKLKNAIDRLNDTKLYAPFSGYITKVMYENREMVNTGTAIASMINISTMKVEVNVPASMYINRALILDIYCTQENLPGERFPLALYASNAKANDNGLYKLYLRYTPEKGSKLSAGMNVSVTIQYKSQAESTLSIPLSAVFEKDESSYVWVVKNGKVQSQEVSVTNLVNNGSVYITEGLQAGEEVVIGGLNLLTENEPVRTLPLASKTNIGKLL